MRSTPRPVQPPRLPSVDEVARRLGAPFLTFVEQPHLAEWAVNTTVVDDRITDASLLYWYFDDPEAPRFRESLWEAVRTWVEPEHSLAEATARHLEHVIRHVAERPEDMRLDEWMSWNPLPAVHEVVDTTLLVEGRWHRAIRIDDPRFVGYGTVVGTRLVTIAGERAKLETLHLALTERPVAT